MVMGADRDANGRFLPGHPGGPGRPRRAIEADYLAALSDAVPMEEWRRIVGTAIDQAIAGDAKAREWVASYLMGKPTGGALVKLAAAELVGYDPVSEEADDLDTLMLISNHRRHVAEAAAAHEQDGGTIGPEAG
jgi:hypothetical protein